MDNSITCEKVIKRDEAYSRLSDEMPFMDALEYMEKGFSASRHLLGFKIRLIDSSDIEPFFIIEHSGTTSIYNLTYEDVTAKNWRVTRPSNAEIQ